MALPFENFPDTHIIKSISYAKNMLATVQLQFEIISPEISIRDQDDWKAAAEGAEKYIVEGSELFVSFTDIGKKIRQILKDNLK